MNPRADRTYGALPDRVMVQTCANPYGPGTVVRQDDWTVVVRLDADGKEYLYGKSAVDPL